MDVGVRHMRIVALLSDGKQGVIHFDGKFDGVLEHLHHHLGQRHLPLLYNAVWTLCGRCHAQFIFRVRVNRLPANFTFCICVLQVAHAVHARKLDADKKAAQREALPRLHLLDDCPSA
eukprot:974680-Rhodomonas_salina.2